MVHAPYAMVHAPPLVHSTTGIWVVKTTPLELESMAQMYEMIKKNMHFGHTIFFRDLTKKCDSG